MYLLIFCITYDSRKTRIRSWEMKMHDLFVFKAQPHAVTWYLVLRPQSQDKWKDEKKKKTLNTTKS